MVAVRQAEVLLSDIPFPEKKKTNDISLVNLCVRSLVSFDYFDFDILIFVFYDSS